MQTQEVMNVSKHVILNIVLFNSLFLFSQKKQDVYFIMNKDNHKYIILGKLNKFLKSDIITVYDRKEYEYHQKKITEAKKKGKYYFDHEGGRDNLKIHVSKLTFEIKEKKSMSISHCELHKLRIIDYKWLLTEGWKQINGKDITTGKPLSFKNIYFLSRIDKEEYISYKVGVTVIAY